MISLLKNDLKQLREIILLFIGLLSITFILSLLSLKEDIVASIFFLVIMVMTFVVPVINFSYLHNKTKATHIMSLPWTRHQLFITKYCSGLIVIILPLMIYEIASLLGGISLLPLLPLTFMLLIYYTLGCLVALLTGTALMYGFLYITITVLPIILYTSLLSLFTYFIHGIENFHFLDSMTMYLVPFFKLFETSLGNETNVGFYIIYAIYIIAILVLNFISNHYRGTENTGKGLVFPILGEVIKNVILLCFSWVVTTFIIFTLWETGYILVIYATVTLLFSILFQMSKNKKMNIRYIIIQTVAICAFTTITFYTSKYMLENSIPKNVDSVIFRVGSDIDTMVYELTPIKDKDGIQKIKDIHQYLIDETNKERWKAGPIVYIKYMESDGDETYREYYINDEQYQTINNLISDNAAIAKSRYSLYEVLQKEMSKASYIGCNTSITQVDSSDEILGYIGGEDLKKFLDIYGKELQKGYTKTPVTISDVSYNLYIYRDDIQTIHQVKIMETSPFSEAVGKYIELKVLENEK